MKEMNSHWSMGTHTMSTTNNLRFLDKKEGKKGGNKEGTKKNKKGKKEGKKGREQGRKKEVKKEGKKEIDTYCKIDERRIRRKNVEKE